MISSVIAAIGKGLAIAGKFLVKAAIAGGKLIASVSSKAGVLITKVSGSAVAGAVVRKGLETAALVGIQRAIDNSVDRIPVVGKPLGDTMLALISVGMVK